ncbi:tail fiber assembly protein [Aeromonas sp. FDAARGOS 1417]|uniref:tail fiber assembly protein n=1 Tax=Aeromonas TaxID=642 RepID=UPI001C23E90D|nr:tail fiber assembly protein [Aeromonas sp. FDAARGOS 1417]QWZ62544.1 tail fiber assembly protein [Aeromonas sp. FDAARGOS 1417]
MKVIHHYLGFETYQIEQGVMFCRDSQNNDWYDISRTMSNDVKVLHMLLDDNRVCSTSRDHTMLYPAGFDVVSVRLNKSDKEPVCGDFIEIVGDELTIVPPPIHIVEATANNERARLLNIADAYIGPLRDAKEMGQASEEELARLFAWQEYRIELMRLPQSEGWPSDVTWPDTPQ